jgi:hypothetical protein
VIGHAFATNQNTGIIFEAWIQAAAANQITRTINGSGDLIGSKFSARRRAGYCMSEATSTNQII